MKRIFVSILWIVGFFVLAAIASGLLNGLFIASGLYAFFGDKTAYFGAAITDALLLGAVVLGIYLSVRGKLPGTKNTL